MLLISYEVPLEDLFENFVLIYVWSAPISLDARIKGVQNDRFISPVVSKRLYGYLLSRPVYRKWLGFSAAIW